MTVLTIFRHNFLIGKVQKFWAPTSVLTDLVTRQVSAATVQLPKHRSMAQDFLDKVFSKEAPSPYSLELLVRYWLCKFSSDVTHLRPYPEIERDVI